MRLTLRTLLAYVDEVLEPADRDEIAKKLEHSDFANDLIHRMKDTVRRLRLSAPQIVGTGMGLDPNTVAEYLDNTLPPDSVADLERICLESDLHLAEVASCHHVLTMVLGEPAEVDPASRQKMYSIPSGTVLRRDVRVDAAHPAAVGADVLATAPSASPLLASSPATPRAERRLADIPDYLRASARSALRMPLAVLAATLLLAVTALLVFGLRGWFGGQRELAAGPAEQPPAGGPAMISPSTANDAQTDATGPSSGNDVGRIPEEATGETTMPATTINQSPPPLLTPGLEPIEPSHVDDDDRYATGDSAALPAIDSATDSYENPAAAAGTDRIEGPVLSGLPPAGTLPTTDLADAARPGSAESMPEARVGGDRTIASSAGLQADGQAAVSPDVAAARAADLGNEPTPSDTVAEMGTYLDGKNILLRQDATTGQWFRLLPRSTVSASDHLLALPAFYPRITMTSGIHLKLAGGTLVSLGADEATGAAGASAAPTVDVKYGQVVVVNTTNQENDMRLVIGETEATVRLVPNATLAVDVGRSYVPGRDPRQSPSPLRAHLYVPDGSIVWDDGQGPRTIEAPSQWSVASDAAMDLSTPTGFPEWIDAEPVEQRSEQVWGVPVVEQSIDATRPVENQLLELYQGSRRREVKSLVARSSVYVGLFVPFVEALRDSDQSAMWKTHIETLRAAMALGPESADKIYQTLVEQRGKSAARDLYEMLCGYDQDQIGRTPAEIAAGPIPRLIDWLEEDSLDYRVLAVQDLWEIRGKRFLTNPAGGPSERARGVRVWRERLRSGELDDRPDEAPSKDARTVDRGS